MIFIMCKKSIVNEFFKMIPKFEYHDNGKYLDGKMLCLKMS